MPGTSYKLFDCKVKTLKSDGSMITPKKEVTIPELFVLKTIHGQDSIKDVTPSLDAKGKPKVRNNVPAGAEVDRLRQIYNRPNNPVVNKLFPGAFPQLPSSLSAIGIVLYAPPQPLPTEMGEDAKPEDGDGSDMSEEELEAATRPEELSEEEKAIRARFAAGQEKRKRNAETGRHEAATQ